jgi:hypothetical protein
MNRIITLLSNLFKSKRTIAAHELLIMEYLEELMQKHDEEILREYVRIRVIEQFTAKIKSRLNDYLIEKSRTENRVNWRIGEDKLVVAERKTYDYSNDSYWNKLNDELFLMKKKLKEHEARLLEIKNDSKEDPIFLDVDGMNYSLNRPELKITHFLRFDSKR